MQIAHFIASGFQSLPFPLIGNLVLAAVTIAALALAWSLMLRPALGLVLAFTIVVAVSAIAVEIDYGPGDGFGQLFVSILIVGLAIYFAITALICKAIVKYRLSRLGRQPDLTSAWDVV